MLSVDELIDHAVKYARTILVDQPKAELIPTWLVQTKDKTTVVGTPWRGDREKEMIIFAMRMMLKKEKAVSYSLISEAWAAFEDAKHPTGLRPMDREDRREVLIVNAFDRQGGKMRIYEVVRGPDATVTDLVLEDAKDGPDHFEGRLYNLLRD